MDDGIKSISLLTDEQMSFADAEYYIEDRCYLLSWKEYIFANIQPIFERNAFKDL